MDARIAQVALACRDFADEQNGACAGGPDQHVDEINLLIRQDDEIDVAEEHGLVPSLRR